MEIKKVAMIGAGTMGHGICQVVSSAGMAVCLNDINDDILADAEVKITKSVDRSVSKGRITEKEKEEVLSRISYTTDLQKAVQDADLVIEAILENLELKKEMFEKFEALTRPETILASNTSQYSITEIASVVKDPSRVIGMHWFNPPVVMKLIEVVRGLGTAEDVIDTIKEFSAKVGKETVVCRDSQGFISTRILVALRLECYRLLEEGVASKEDIDKTLRLAFGHPMGQFELADLSGLDIEIPICESLTKIFGDRFRPPQNLLHTVKAGRLGRKSGRGWYEY